MLIVILIERTPNEVTNLVQLFVILIMSSSFRYSAVHPMASKQVEAGVSDFSLYFIWIDSLGCFSQEIFGSVMMICFEVL